MGKWGGTLESLVALRDFWRGRRVLITGCTGFKGSWLTLWLSSLEARVYGYSLASKSSPSFYELARIDELLEKSFIKDVRDTESLKLAVDEVRPSVIFHLAAQPLVLESYRNPLETIETNILGTTNLLEAIRLTPDVDAFVNVTTDKCYENNELGRAFEESDPLGGHDLYACSKACSELITKAYYDSFFCDLSEIGMATARAGNVIGGGDWSPDRLIPDAVRSSDTGQVLRLRSPESIRPWQHVLEPVFGYLLLAYNLVKDPHKYSGSWNLGPSEASFETVQKVVELARLRLVDLAVESGSYPHNREAVTLRLNSQKAHQLLNWRSIWPLEVALAESLDWYLRVRNGEDARVVSEEQIGRYLGDLSRDEFFRT